MSRSTSCRTAEAPSRRLNNVARQEGRYRPRQAQEGSESRQGIFRPPQEHNPRRQGRGRQGDAIRLSRPQEPQARVPRAVDPADQRGGARARADLQPVHLRPRHGGNRGRPQGAVRARHFRARCFRCDRGAGQRPSAQGGVSRDLPLAGEGRGEGKGHRPVPTPSHPARRATFSRGREDFGGARPLSRSAMSDLAALQLETLAAIEGASDEAALESVRVAALGKKGSISALLATLGKLSPEERRTQGAAINALKDQVTEALAARRAVLKKVALEAQLKREALDVTLPVRLPGIETGRIHPISQVTEEIVAIFADMGFAVAEGPDIETDDNNFTRLNFPPGHPAREAHDTFFFSPNAEGERLLLRTHTSTVQVRTMLAQKPPIRIIAPGRVYRMDSDQTHTPMFHQVEGLVIDRDTHMGHLKWVLEEFCKAFFEVSVVKMRFRMSHFPFTEPSAEVDIQCDRSGAELKIGQGNDWLEILGCGMVHPNVLKACGIDPDEWQGFAFGMGIDRIAMLKYGMPDLRAFFSGDLRWLKHYGFAPLSIPSLAAGLSS